MGFDFLVRAMLYVNMKFNYKKYLKNYQTEKEYMASNIRYAGHSLESWAKREAKNPQNDYAVKMASNAAKNVRDLMSEYLSKGYPLDPDIKWAKDLESEYQQKTIKYQDDFGCIKQQNDFKKVIETRRSIRNWKINIELKKSDILECAKLAQWAPSSCNRQTVKYIIVTDTALKRVLSIARTGVDRSELIVNANAVCLVLVDKRPYIASEAYAPALDVGCSIQTFLLALWSKGIGSCWIYFNLLRRKGRKLVYKSFDIPPHYELHSLVAMGVPADIPLPPPRKKVENFCVFEKFK